MGVRISSEIPATQDQTIKISLSDEGTRIITAKNPLARWRERVRVRVEILVVLSAILLLGILYTAKASHESSPRSREPNTLTRQPIESSFGLGNGVDYEATDSKTFDFEFFAADDAVGILHFQASDISPNEVTISVNEVEIGTIPPDVVDTRQATHELLIPAKLLRKGQKNRIDFDNVRNPPGRETWRIWNLWIEVYLLPKLSSQEAIAEANRVFRRAQEKWERRDVAAANRHDAWKQFRDAWLILEGVSAENFSSKTDLYELIRANMTAVQRDLDRTCDKLLLEAQTEFLHKKLAETRATLDQVQQYFPDKFDQPCWKRAERRRTDFGL